MKTVIIGLDAFDPSVFERLSERGKLPNLTKCVEAGGYSRFAVTSPPQTEVSWTSIATGLNPGGHGIFDFVHRNPSNYTPYVSLLPTRSGPFGTQFVPPHRARTIFEEATRQGFPAIALWWPAMFPARPEMPVRVFPGLGTPDIHGRWGVGTLFSNGDKPVSDERKTALVSLNPRGQDRYTGVLNGPARKKWRGSYQSTLDLHLEITSDESARLGIDDQVVDLVEGKWSPILTLSFRMGRMLKAYALTRVILTQVRPTLRLYALPLQLHPLHALWRYATPRSFVKETWKACGPFLTLGWPQDTTALEEACITDAQFLDLCESIFSTREQILMRQLEHFNEGVLASVFDSLDRVQHMFWRDRPDIVKEWYIRCDALIGRVAQRLADPMREQVKLIVISDHGFSSFDHKVHLNRWLIDHGYLAVKEHVEAGGLQDVDWSCSRAYAVGLNGVYLNVQGREGQGTIPSDQRESALDELCQNLEGWQGLDGEPVIQRLLRQDEAFQGPMAVHGPDIVLGFSPGYRASADTGLGKWGEHSIELNQDHWGADHCFDSQAVPGVLFCSHSLANYPSPSYRDMPVLAIGTTIDTTGSAPPPSFGEEDQEIVEERLRSLGYL